MNIPSSNGICRFGYLPVQGIMQYAPLLNAEYKMCGQHLTCSEFITQPGPGCYCKEGYRLNTTSGKCHNALDCSPTNPIKSLDLSEYDRQSSTVTAQLCCKLRERSSL